LRGERHKGKEKEREEETRPQLTVLVRPKLLKKKWETKKR